MPHHHQGANREEKYKDDGVGAESVGLTVPVPHCQLVSIKQKSQLAVLHFINVRSYVTGAQTAECSPACSPTCM